MKFEGTDGWICVNRAAIDASNPDFLTEPLPANATRLYVSNNHMGNFFDCVRTPQAAAVRGGSRPSFGERLPPRHSRLAHSAAS